MIKFPLFLLASALLCSCSVEKQPSATLEGAWVQPVPGLQNQRQGMLLLPGGKASSINMKTLVYRGWNHQGDSLTLTGKSIGNRQTIDFTRKLKIKKLTIDTLELEDNGRTDSYSRLKHASKCHTGRDADAPQP